MILFKQSVSSASKVVCASLLGFVLVTASSSVFAAEAKFKPRSLPGISEKVFKAMGKITELISPDTDENPDAKPNPPAALKTAEALEKKCIKDKCNGYEMAQVYRMLGYVVYQMDRPADAVKYYKKVVAQSPNIPVGIELENLYYIAQLQYSLDKMSDAIDMIRKHKKLSEETGKEITPQVYDFEARLCWQNDDKKCALRNITKAISIVEGRGSIADESWYVLQRSVHDEKEDYKKSLPIHEKLIRHYPKKSYWPLLASYYGLLERDKDQLGAMDAAYMQGALTRERQIINLAKLYLFEGVPAKSVQLIQKGMKDKVIPRTEDNLDLLATMQIRAKDFADAAKTLEAAGKNAKTGKHHARLVGVYFDLDKPLKAIKAGETALERGKLKDSLAGEIRINMGMAYSEVRQFTKSIESFEKAAEFKKYERTGKTWKRYIENERARYNGLKESLSAVGLDIEKVFKNQK
jgi:tetratricopeptide (TPR) repeat protein